MKLLTCKINWLLQVSHNIVYKIWGSRMLVTTAHDAGDLYWIIEITPHFNDFLCYRRWRSSALICSTWRLRAPFLLHFSAIEKIIWRNHEVRKSVTRLKELKKHLTEEFKWSRNKGNLEKRSDICQLQGLEFISKSFADLTLFFHCWCTKEFEANLDYYLLCQCKKVEQREHIKTPLTCVTYQLLLWLLPPFTFHHLYVLGTNSQKIHKYRKIKANLLMFLKRNQSWLTQNISEHGPQPLYHCLSHKFVMCDVL